MRLSGFSAAALLLLLALGCARSTRRIGAVEGFELDRYLGAWYEIARLPHRFEKGLSRVTAEYGRNEDSTIAVTNRGYDAARGTWREARAVAWPAGDPTVGELRVRFFWPLTADYRIIALDKEAYTWAVVTSSRMSYFWILSRTPDLDAQVRDALIARAREWGFDADRLILVSHD